MAAAIRILPLCLALLVAACATPGPETTTTAAFLPADATFTIAAINGPPPTLQPDVARALDQAARDAGIRVRNGNGGDYTITGYLSVINGESGVLVVWVFDVNGAGGARVHRVSGQYQAPPASPGNPWASIDRAALEAIADAAMAQIAAWAHPPAVAAI
ncbi:MAG: hypothetical protein KIS96_12820 [Bauldia sp.]|nr:hypothetical protein [Bauldia sp.]